MYVSGIEKKRIGPQDRCVGNRAVDDVWLVGSASVDVQRLQKLLGLRMLDEASWGRSFASVLGPDS